MNTDYEVEHFTSGMLCLEQLHRKPVVVCLDFGRPDMTGDVHVDKIMSENDSFSNHHN